MSENIKLKVSSNNEILARLKIAENIREVSNIEVFTGQYEVVPKPDEATILETANKKMTDNVTVTPIPYSEVSNEYGGNTITIGGSELWR